MALLLGAPASEIPFSAKFDPETLDSLFHISSDLKKVESNVKLCADAAYVLLAMARSLLHKVSCLSFLVKKFQYVELVWCPFIRETYKSITFVFINFLKESNPQSQVQCNY